eukprot:6209173-Pleurochrysis_carterae.AAC.2
MSEVQVHSTRINAACIADNETKLLGLSALRHAQVDPERHGPDKPATARHHSDDLGRNKTQTNKVHQIRWTSFRFDVEGQSVATDQGKLVGRRGVASERRVPLWPPLVGERAKRVQAREIDRHHAHLLCRLGPGQHVHRQREHVRRQQADVALKPLGEA